METPLEKNNQNSFCFPFVTKNNKAIEKRRNFLKDYSISPDYHLAILSYINDCFGLEGKRVLELGGSNIPREILLEDFKVRQYVGIDYIDSWWTDPNHKIEKVYPLNESETVFSKDQPYLIFSGRIDDAPDKFLAEKFDIIVSFSSVEHFENLTLMLEKSFNMLKEGGLYFASSEPIWSSAKGHHFWIGEDYNFHVTNDFDFAHLIYNKQEFLNKFNSCKDIGKIATQIYDWNGINRLFYLEIEKAVLASSFTLKEIYPFIKHPPQAEQLVILIEKYQNRIKSPEDFSIRGIQWVLKK